MRQVGTVLVTGASGFIGAHLVRRLVAEGFSVVGLYTNSDNLCRLAGVRNRLVFHQTDLRNTSQLTELFGQYRFKWVFHLAAHGVRAELDTVEDVVRVNTLATVALARTALEHGVDRFVHMGSGFEYRPQAHPIDESIPLVPLNFYGATKAAALVLIDYLYRVEGLPLVTFRPFSVYGPGEHPSRFVPYVIGRALALEPIDLTHGLQIRDYLFVEDVVDALLKGASHRSAVGETYNLGAGPQGAYPIRRVVETILRLTGAPPNLPRYGAGNRPRLEPPYFVADSSKAQVHLGWQSNTSIEDGLARTVAWYRDNTTL